MMGKMLYAFLNVSVVLAVVVAHQGDIQLGRPVSLPCQDDDYRNTPSELLDIQWWTGEHLVLRFHLSRIIQGHRYINRTYLSEGLRNGDFSLSITHTEYSDSGLYRCVLTKDGQEVTLGEIEIQVKIPKSQSALFVESKQRVILPCFGRFDWSGSEAAFVQWKRWAQVVLQWTSGSLYVNPMFEGRVSVPKERILHDDMSLIFKKTQPDDQGYYVCFFKKNNDIRPSTIIHLTITERMSTVNKSSGSQFQLPLPDESPVMLNFLPAGGNSTVTVCEVEKHRLTCDQHYSDRTLLQNNSLILRNLTSADSGTFFLREKATSRTRNVLIVQIFIMGTKVTHGPLLIALLISVVAGVALLFALGFSVYRLYNKKTKLKGFPDIEETWKKEAEKGCEMQPLQSIDNISHQGSISSISSAAL